MDGNQRARPIPKPRKRTNVPHVGNGKPGVPPILQNGSQASLSASQISSSQGSSIIPSPRSQRVVLESNIFIQHFI